MLRQTLSLDGDGYIFIVDSMNHRIIGSSVEWFSMRRRLYKCTTGSASNQLSYPKSLSFDSHGNMWVIDFENKRLQKFVLTLNHSGRCRCYELIAMSTCFVADVSFNQPELCPNATWNENGITFANNSTIGAYPQAIFIDKSNTVYASNFQSGSIQIWLEGSTSPTSTIVTHSNKSYAMFVSVAGDIYIDNGLNYRVDVWRENASNYPSTLLTGGQCFSLFVDTNNSLYCSLYAVHVVIRRSLNSSDTQLTTVAGTGCSGFLADALYYPRGIFVAIDFDLYVADAGNNRVQLFEAGQVNGTTVAGSGAPGTVHLYYPTAVILDADDFVFITDSNNYRIVGSGPDGFRCIVGCTAAYGSAANQLSIPQGIAFDSYGNIFVIDRDNHRVQKFLLSFNACSK